jgi:hypothetical protein
LKSTDFIPSLQDQSLLCKELTFLVATSLLNNIDQLQNVKKIYPKHLEHQYSAQSGLKTQQVKLTTTKCVFCESLTGHRNFSIPYTLCNLQFKRLYKSDCYCKLGTTLYFASSQLIFEQNRI